MTLMGAKSARMTPAERLAVKGIVRGVDPGAYGPGWMALSELYSDLATGMLARVDVAAVVAPNAAGGAPGRWIPIAARLDLDGSMLPADPAELDITGDLDHLRAFAAMHGVFHHEIGHAEHTRWLGADVGADVSRVMALLEESRMEAQVCIHRPTSARWLRSAATHLLLTGIDDVPADAYGAAHVAALTVGRVKAGSLYERDIAKVRDWLADQMTTAQLAALDGLLDECVNLDDEDTEGLADLAARWLAAFPPEAGEDGEAGGSGEGGEWREVLRAVLSEAAGEAAEDATSDIDADERAWGELAGAAEALEALEARESDDDGEEPEGPHGRTSGYSDARWRLRTPTAAEQAARRALAAKMRLARTRERAVTTRSSMLPPGRLDSRGAVRADAEAHLGLVPSATPWKRKVRRTVESPRLRLAVCTDISGSMDWAASRISSAMWTLAAAVADSGGVAVGAVFGCKATSIFDTRRKSCATHVMDFDAPDGTEAIADCLELVDAALGLDAVSGSVDEAVVVIITDGEWVDHSQASRADAWLAAAGARGVRTIIVGVGEHVSPEHPCDVRVVLREPADLVPVLGKAFTDALRPKARTGATTRS